MPKGRKNMSPARPHKITSNKTYQDDGVWNCLQLRNLILLSALCCIIGIAWHFVVVPLLTDHWASSLRQSSDATHNVLPQVPQEQKWPLSRGFAVDIKSLLQTREENMKKYNFSHDRHGVDRRRNLTLEEFRDVYDGKWPVLLTDEVPAWRASNWTQEFFLQNYGDERVVMKAVEGGLSSAVTLALPLKVFHAHSHEATPSRWTYLQDELFIPTRPALMDDVGISVYQREDLFQLFPGVVRPWGAMLLWGTAHSRSTLHIDPYNWTGTNAVLTGRKRWKMFPPGQDAMLYVTQSNSGFPLDCTKYNSAVDSFDADLTRYPTFKTAVALEFDQHPGEMLIIPSGWFHQAYNMEETIAVSSQMMNRHNYRSVLEEIFKTNPELRTKVPADVDTAPPALQVEAVLAGLSPEVLEMGKAITEDALNQINMAQQKK